LAGACRQPIETGRSFKGGPFSFSAMAPTRKSWSIDRIRRQFYSVFKERLNAAWAAYPPYCFSITKFWQCRRFWH